MSTGLALKATSLKINHIAILSDITIHFPLGKFYGVLGPNGAGKTSLLKLISGQQFAEGEIRWQGRKLSDYSPQQLAQQIAVVNQVNDTVFALTTQQVVTMGLLPHKGLLSRYTDADKINVEQALKDVGLADKSHQHFSALSGGEQQRCLIARALVQGAPLLILDEPVNHLDVYYQHQILHLLHQLCLQQGKTVIVSLHDLNLAAAYCDQITLLNHGKCLAHGSPSEVFRPDLLSATFNLPCKVHTTEQACGIRVEFIPPISEYQQSHTGQQP
ncbi:ABC transporter ATP-binding protein [Alteromonas sp. C1M14]|uniref:ABC transporter ATP-binding protein n=1 Tax=Alteromonas sp. C1M14 TaxID=2841567 RepID=UPI001C08C436|nr:ABC transporter ATP-binding protein [Alteromonas sp. C1M14]MBU2979616.1 ABC transporter ATP-binding protein [Alteromonas sp. C1M14]